MQFYRLKDRYIEYLKQFDEKVPDNKNEKRPYVGVVIQIGDMKYYAPFSSPKPKHQNMKNGKDFRKIANGKLGAINFNNMLPVLDCALISFDMESIQDKKYQMLMRNQYRAIRDDWDNITKTARELRDMLLTPDEHLSDYQRRVKSRCCDIVTLERIFRLFTEE